MLTVVEVIVLGGGVGLGVLCCCLSASENNGFAVDYEFQALFMF